MTNTDFKVIVCALIHNEQNQILLARRKQDKILGGLWEFPGGKVEHGEELEAALKREIKEELNIEIRVDELIFVKPFLYPHGAVLILFYKSQLVSGTPELTDHDTVEWCHANNLKNHNLLPANKEVLKHLENSALGESQ